MAKYPYLAHVVTEFGGMQFYRCKTLECAIDKVNSVVKFGDIKVVVRYVTNTKKEIVWKE